MIAKKLFNTLLLIIFLLWGGSSELMAEDIQSIAIHLKSGERIFIPFYEDTTLKFDDGSLIIADDNYAITEIKKYTFEPIPAGIGIIETVGDIVFSMKDGYLYVKDSGKEKNINLYDVNGIRYELNVIQIDNETKSIDITGLSPNLYILNIGGESLKFLKK